MAKANLTNTQRARLCAIKDERGMVILSSVVVTDVMVEALGTFDLLLHSDIPVFWLPERDRVAVAGSNDWEDAIKLFGFGLVAIGKEEWCTETVLAKLRDTFPHIEVATAGAGE